MGELLNKTMLLINGFGLNDLDKSGQNFLIDENIIKKEVDSADLHPDDVVLDIGAGFGYVLGEVNGRCAAVGIEKDVKIFSYLLDKYELVKSIKLINGDALRIIFPAFNKVISNPPYTIVDRILNKLTKYSFASGVMILPKTVSDGLTGSSEYKKPNKFLAIQKVFFSFEEIMEVPKEAFYPVPRVTSKMVGIKRKPYDLQQAVIKRDEMTVKNAILRAHQEIGDATKRESRDFLTGIGIEKLEFKDKEVKSLTVDELDRLLSFVTEKYSDLAG